MVSTVTSDGEAMVVAGRGVKQNQHAHDDMQGLQEGRRSGSRVVLVCFTCPATTVVTVVLMKMDLLFGNLF